MLEANKDVSCAVAAPSKTSRINAFVTGGGVDLEILDVAQGGGLCVRLDVEQARRVVSKLSTALEFHDLCDRLAPPS